MLNGLSTGATITNLANNAGGTIQGLPRFQPSAERGRQVLPWFEARKNRPLIREQAFGESLDPDKLERLGRYEVHLDRKLERTLAMFLRLKDLRQGTIAG